MSNAEAVVDSTETNSARISEVLLLYSFCFALVVFVGGTAQALSLRLGLAVTLVLLILLPALIYIRYKGVGLAHGLRLRAVKPSIVVSSFFLGLGTWGVGVSIALGLEAIGLKTMDQGLDLGLDSPAGFLLCLLVIAVGPGICEESLFRGVIQGVLERKGKWFAVIVTAILFGLIHLMLGTAIPAAVLGVFFGWTAIRTGSIIPAMVAHFANNAAAMSFLYFLNGEIPSWLLPSLLVVGVIAVVAIIRLSSADQERITDSPLAEVPAGLPLWSALGCMVPLLMLAALVVGMSSALPYFIQVQKLDDGQQVIFVEQDSLLFDPMMEKKNVKVLYGQGEELRIGRLVEFSDDLIQIRDGEGNEIEMPTSDFKGVVIHP